MSLLHHLRDSFPIFPGGALDRDRLDQPSLRRQVVAGVLGLVQRGVRGRDTLPPAVTVRVRVGRGASLEVVRGFVDDPAFDAEVKADLLNRLVGADAAALPLLLYDVTAGEGAEVTVEEAADRALVWLEVDGGDRHGTRYELKASQASCPMGRGPWHGDDRLIMNQVVLSDGDRFVSRRAAVLRRAGSRLEVEVRDQGEHLTVVRADGRRVRPRHVRRGAVHVDAGDTIELDDGEGQSVRLLLHRRSPSGR